MNLQNPPIEFKKYKKIPKLTGLFARFLSLYFFDDIIVSLEIVNSVSNLVISLRFPLFSRKGFFRGFHRFESFCVAKFSICQSLSRKIRLEYRDYLPMTLLPTGLSLI